MWSAQIVSTVIWTLADANCGEDVGTSDVGRRPTFYSLLIPTPDWPTLSITSSDRCRRPVSREKNKKPRCLILGTRTIATSIPKGSEVGQMSRQSRGQGGSDKKDVIWTRTARTFPIVCEDFCHLSKCMESQAHTSERKCLELTRTGCPAGTMQKFLTSGRHLAS